MAVIQRFSEAEWPGPLMPNVEGIFFASAVTRAFASRAVRDAFRERWLGRYFRRWPDWCFIAIMEDGALGGYLAGCPEDVVGSPLFADLTYYDEFAPFSASYPAHLHVNVHPDQRRHGIGSRLVETFAERCAVSGLPGVHAVTGAESRSVRFYMRAGFACVANGIWDGRGLAFMARELP